MEDKIVDILWNIEKSLRQAKTENKNDEVGWNIEVIQQRLMVKHYCIKGRIISPSLVSLGFPFQSKINTIFHLNFSIQSSKSIVSR